MIENISGITGYSVERSVAENIASDLMKEEKLRTDILNAFREVVAFYSPTHEILWLNDAGKKQLNIEDDSYIGKLCYELWFHPNGPCQSCPVVSRKFEPTERLVKLSGDRIWIVRLTPLFDKDKSLRGFIEYRADITQISNLEKQIIDEREKYKMLAGFNNTAFYPSVSDLQSSLTIANSSSSHYTLKIMSYVSLLIPFVLAYIIYVWRAISNNKTSLDDLENEHVY
jgi:hypothetical protein